MLRRPALLAFCALAWIAGCGASGSSTTGESADTSGDELAAALSGHVLDAPDMAGTFDAETAAAASELRRFILLRDGTALACAAPAACRPSDVPVAARRPYVVVEAGARATRYLVLRTSATDSTPFRVYAVERSGAPSSDEWTFREVKRGSPPLPGVAMQRLPCSETMYDEADADHACALYQCKLDRAAPDQRCSYFSDFGLPYCKKYFRTDFDDRRFGPRVRQCLQEAIRDRMDGMTCGAVEQAAIPSHVDCYVASGYCTLSLADKLRISTAIEPKDLTFDIAQTFAKIEKSCLGLHTD